MDLPSWTAAPFVVLLACVAVLPVVRGAWWHHNRSKAIVAAACAVPVAAYLVWHGPDARHALGHELVNYLSFVVLLTALYVIAGGVAVTGGVRATPGGNALLLAGGVVLANLVGTTGASMLLVRPFLSANAGRTRRRHLPVFFIFMVCNTGGLLTPLGDPPLFLGYLNGVPFTWTLQLWPQWLAVNAALLVLFVLVDAAAARAERRGRGPDAPLPARPGPPRVEGLRVNGPLLVGVVLAVAFQKELPPHAAELVLAALTAVSLLATPRRVREANRFTWGPAVEVAVLFAGIFVTMTPALALLQQHGGRLGLTRPWEFFWATGVLSSVLDNAPTYLTLGTVAADGRGLQWLAANDPARLAAVSCGAVFMGANSYVGNGPNFLVKAVAEDAGYPVPSFLGYMLVAALVLGPVFAGVTLVFFE